MKWEKVKEAVADKVWYGVMHGYANSWSQVLVDELFSDFAVRKGMETDGVQKGRRPGLMSIEVYAQKAYDVVMKWDVRRAGDLRKLFPDYFPKSLRQGVLTGDYDTDGDWAVYKENETN